jgi:exopolysaccharide biosynthesis polyprenyl glycosylphosphotransferase
VSAQLHEETIEPLRVAPLQAVAVPHELPELVRPRVSRRTAQRLAAFGRAGLIWLPAYTFSVAHIVSLATALAAATLITAVWCGAIQLGSSAFRLITPALGSAGRAGIGSVFGFVAVSALGIWAPWAQIHPLTLLEMTGSVFLFLAAWEKVVSASPAVRRRVLIVGAADGGAEIIEELAVTGETMYDVVGIVDDERETDIGHVPRLGNLADVPWILELHRPDLVVLAVAKNRPEAFSALLSGSGAGFELLGLAEFHEQAFGRVPVRHVTAAWFMSVLHYYRRPYTQCAKRTFDVIGSTFALLFSAPLFLAIMLLVRRTPGPVIYRQTRLGENGRHFTMLKFRTMRDDAEADGEAIWADENDGRTTSVGRFLRRSRLDELPQLWNVLKGEMSIVGPRPERPEFVDVLRQTVPFWTRRHLVKPGITGWAQVRRGYTSDTVGTAEKLSYDLWYLRHRSLVTDLAICAKTFATLLSGAGAR